MPPSPSTIMRELIPADQCVFCQSKTDVEVECTHCGFKSAGTCQGCLGLGAPSIRHPRRMAPIKYRIKDKKTGAMMKKIRYVCYPMCAREAAYRCRRCERWVDKSMLHAASRQEQNINWGLCIDCSVSEHLSICASCHCVCGQREEHRDSEGYRCETCFGRNNRFKSKSKGFPVIVKSKNVKRTFGMELEINNVHRATEMSTAIGDINVNGVEFNVKSDGSIHFGFEIVSFPAEKRLLLPAVKGLCQIIRPFKHNHENAGLHVHCADKTSSPVSFTKTWLAVEPLTYMFLPKWRRENMYCVPNRTVSLVSLLAARDIEDAHRIQGGARRAALNLCALSAHGTIEIRCHHATSSYAAIYHWIQYLDALWERSRDLKDEDVIELFNDSHVKITDASALKILTKLRIPAKTMRFYMKRKKFYDHNQNGLPDDERMSRFEGDNAEEPRIISRALRTSLRMGNNHVLQYSTMLRQAARRRGSAEEIEDLPVRSASNRTQPFPEGTNFCWSAGCYVGGAMCPQRTDIRVMSPRSHELESISTICLGGIFPPGGHLASDLSFSSQDVAHAREVLMTTGTFPRLVMDRAYALTMDLIQQQASMRGDNSSNGTNSAAARLISDQRHQAGAYRPVRININEQEADRNERNARDEEEARNSIF